MTLTKLVKPVAEWCASLIEFIGIAIITGFAIYALAYAVLSLIKHANKEDVFEQLRHRFGQGVLLGLEFLVAADIIITVAVELTITTVATLAFIVLIRTFLSFTLEVELDGKWPWQQGR